MKDDIIKCGVYKLEFSIDYIQGKQFEASFVVNMKDNLKFVRINEYAVYGNEIVDGWNPLHNHSLINIVFNPRVDKMSISVIWYITQEMPKEKLIEITKPFVCEEIYRRFIKP